MIGKHEGVDMRLTDTEVEANRNAHEARVAIVGVDLGRWGTRVVLRLVQALRIVPRA